MSKVIFVLSDGLNYEAATLGMGYLSHLVETKQASLYRVLGELPGMSRPMYETLHTGLPVSEHGIVANSVVRPSSQPNVFRLASAAGRVTAAAAYSWFSELYNHVPYDRINDREVDDEKLTIQHGRYYTQDDYPDLELLLNAALLVRKFQPDYLLAHPMGMDYIGEMYGCDSKEYRSHAITQDSLLAPLVAEWLQMGYVILVSGDHGINRDGRHGGEASREVPLYLIGAGNGLGKVSQPISQLQIAPTLLKLLGVPIPATMKHPPII